MTDRSSRYAAFDDFREGAKELFQKHAESTPEYKRLDNLYSLCICPGGRFGGSNKKEVEIFFGNRPFDSVTEIGENLQKINKLETAHGATLSYQRTDDGQVLCTLSPAASENYRPKEDFIFLGIVKDPAELKKKSKRHWKIFLAYMESTCLDGKPNLCQKARVFYLRNFKESVVQKTLQRRPASVVSGEILKYTATVGLSGFVILLVTWVKESGNAAQITQRHQELVSAYAQIEENTSSIAKSAAALEIKVKGLVENNSKNMQDLGEIISRKTMQLERAISNIELIYLPEKSEPQHEEQQ